MFLWILLIPKADAYHLDEHSSITNMAINNLSTCIPLAERERKVILNSNRQEDLNLIEKWGRSSHYYNPHFQLPLRRNTSDTRIAELESRNPPSIGAILHHMQDITIPQHVVGVVHGWTDHFELLRTPLPESKTLTKEQCFERIKSLPKTQTEYLRTVALDTLRALDQNIQATPEPFNYSRLYEPATKLTLGSYATHTDMFNATIITLDSTYVAKEGWGLKVKSDTIRRAIYHTENALLISYRDRIMTKRRTIQRDSSSSLWNWARDKGRGLRDLPDSFKALDLGENDSYLSVNGIPLFGITDASVPACNQLCFGDLKAVNITVMGKGERSAIGSITTNCPLDFETLIISLINADVIQSYVHIGSELNLNFGDQRVTVDGSHTYFTNTENIDHFAVEVWLENNVLIVQAKE